MKICDYYTGCPVNAFQDSDFNDAFKAIKETAKLLWKAKCESNFTEFGDSGTCVVGAGIYVYYVAPRHRKADKKMIISASSVSCCQGSLNWEHGIEEILGYLKENGIEAKFDYGQMD